MAFRFPAPIVVSFGEEGFFLDRDLAAFRKQPDRSVIELDGYEVDEHEVVSACEQQSFDGRSRVVIVDNAHKVKEGKTLKAFVESRNPKDLDAVLAMVFRSEKVGSTWSKNPGKVFVAERKKLKTFDNKNEVVEWIPVEAKKIGLKLHPSVPPAMFQIVGSDLYRIAAELRKLQLLTGTSEATLEHLKLVVTPAASSDVWQVLDAASAKDAKKAMNALSTLYRFAGDDPSVGLAYALMKQVEKLLLATSLLAKGAADDEIASRLGMHPWRCRSFFLPMARKHSVPRLCTAMRELCRLDVEVKRSAHKRTLVELAVLKLAS